MFENLGETLSKKYGPLPGYAWVGIGGAGIAIVAKLGSKKKTSGNVTLTPASNGELLGSGLDGGGGGGGASLPPDMQTDPGLYWPVPSAPVGTEPYVTASASPDFHTDPLNLYDPAQAASLVSAHVGSLAAGTASPDVRTAAAVVASQPPVSGLAVNAPVLEVASHPQAGAASAPALNTPAVGVNARRPGFQLS